MKVLTKSVKNRIYTVCIDVEGNRVTITRGRGGMSDTKHIFNDDGLLSILGADGVKEVIVRSGTFYLSSSGSSIEEKDVERLLEPVVLDLIRKLESSLQRKE